MLFALAFPDAKNKIFLRYDEIEDFVLNAENFAGVIIHENRFTYADRGLKKIIDLGEFWQTKTNLPIPLGGIVAKRNLDNELIKKVDGLIKQSIEYGYKNYPVLTDYIRNNSQEMDEAVMRKHIELYVNDYSIDLGADGKNAINKFLEIHQQLNERVQNITDAIFIE